MTDGTDRNEAIAEIKSALKQRSGKTWSVRGGKGTSWGWIKIDSPTSRKASEYGYMSEQDRTELASLLGLESVHQQGVSIAASSAYRREYIERANGRVPSKIAEPYWD